MAQKRKLAVAGLNIRIADKDNRDYPALLRAILRMKQPVRVHGSDHLLLTDFKVDRRNDEVPYTGLLAKFTEIDLNADWLDMTSLGEAGEDELEKIEIPDYLKPNYSGFFVNFFPSEHILVFETYSESESLTPSLAERWLKKIVKLPPIVKAFGTVDVTLVPDFAMLDRILEGDIRRLEMRIERPNPDDYDLRVFEEQEEFLRRNNADHEDRALVPNRGEYITPDERTEALSRVAADTGFVKARLDTPEGVKPVSTKGNPLVLQDKYDEDQTSAGTIFDLLSLGLLRRVRASRRGRGQEE